MKQFVDAGLVEREQRGRWAFYRLNDVALGALGAAFADDTHGRGCGDATADS